MKTWADLGERAGFTLLQAGIATSAIELLNLPVWVAIPLAGALSAVKSYWASKYGDGSASAIR